MMWWDEKNFATGYWRYILPALMLFLSWMMVGNVKYPSFKTLDLRAKRTFTKTLVAILFLGSILIFREKILVFVLPAFFTAYLVYGFIRPRISHKMRHEIEEEEEEEEGPTAPG
jgi:CDP-diacylglycerol--serine O-phosphatidyltransferase